ncbi:MAG TPA: hypothetical protein RMH99_22640 [Sandaracinaceae bacterium LLY-WYZ-13_1]|nr:hypothetical protein [Sandaracinaceae bacterium LLY-WYZ-13_1]
MSWRTASLVLLLLCPARAGAQDADGALPVLAADRPLTLRPRPPLRALAQRASRSLALRLDVAVAVGADAPPEVLEAVPEGHVGLAFDDGGLRVVLAGPGGQVYRTALPLDLGDAGAARAVALAVESLRDAALDGPPTGTASRRTYTLADGREVTWIYREREGGLHGPTPLIEANAKPLVALGFLAGGSTERGTLLLGPRLGLGLCLRGQCLVLEGDLPVLADESVACDGRRIRYRPVTLALRVLLRPVVQDELSFAIGAGVLTRFGLASLVDVDVSRITTNFGLRAGVEGAWRFAGPFELVLEGGVDFAVSPARLVRRPRPRPGVRCPDVEAILVEDVLTVWGQLAVRLRP